MTDRYLGMAELVEYSRLSERYLRTLIATGQLKHFRTSPPPRGKILVKQSWWDEYVEERLKAATRVSTEARAFVAELVKRAG